MLLLLVLFGLWVPLCQGSDFAEKGREIFKLHRTAVVTVEIVLHTTYSAAGKTTVPTESKQEITGTVVDPAGLTVVALSACDPGEIYQQLTADRAPYKMQTELGEMKILLEDGTELPAEVVLRDRDLDLAFIRPKSKPSQPLPAVDFSKSGPAEILDDVIALNRLNPAAGRAYAASIEHIVAVMQKPRTFYVPDSNVTATTLGSPAFLTNGSVLGVFAMRAAESAKGKRASVIAVIVPASEIVKLAQTVPAVGNGLSPTKPGGH